jgi:predicted ATPase/DNA-binding CsgD family transcriptional regulator
LLERESDLNTLRDWLEAVPTEGGCLVLVAGEAGIGKTTLLQKFAQGRRGDLQILWGGCEALFTPHPLAPLYDIARQAGGDFPRIIAAATTREITFNATIDHLSQSATPTILIIEDVHWADEATLDLIKFIARRLQRLQVMLVISYRDDEVGVRHPLRSVIGDLSSASVRRLHLAPLSASAVATMAEAAGCDAEDLHAITGGNPFFVTEALAAAANQVPATVRDAVIARLARLSESARAVVDLAAIVPGKTERWLLEGTVGCDSIALQECLAIGMIAFEDGSLAFRHEIARRAVEEHLPLLQRQELHGRILKVLLGRITTEIPTARLVHHAEHAGDDDAVLRFAPLAAESAAWLGAHREAVAHYGSALRHAAALSPERRADLFERLAYECYLTEQISDAIKAREAALALWRAASDQVREGDNLRWLSRLSWFNGQKAAADYYAKLAVKILTALPPGPELAMAYSNCSQLYMLAHDLDPALEWGQKAIDLATTLGDTETLGHALNNVGTARLYSRDDRGREDLERSLRLALDGGFDEHAARAYTNLSSTAIQLRDFAFANRYLQEGISYCEERDLTSWARYMMAFRAVVYLAMGDWTRAAEDAQAIIDHPYVAPVSRIPALTVLALVRARRGEPDVDVLLDEARNLALPTGEPQRLGPVFAARAEAAWLKGNPQAALDEILSAYEFAQRQSNPWMKGELAFWLSRCGGKIDDTSDLVEPFANQIAGNWRQAVADWGRIRCPYEQAMALAEGDEEVALRLALETCERLGAAPLAAILRRKLRANGIRGISRGPQERTRQNPQGLTAKELKVLALLVEGCRNADIGRRLFVSEKTVDHHVSSILAKLEVCTRGEAAAMARSLFPQMERAIVNERAAKSAKIRMLSESA